MGGYDEKMIYGWEDWEFWMALLKNGGSVKCLDHIGFFYRTKQDSMATQINTEKTKVLAEYMSVKHADFYVNQLGSFIELNNQISLTKLEYLEKFKSQKFVIDLFFKTFFKFTIFGKYKE